MTLALRAAPSSSHRYLAGATDDYARRLGRISSGLRIMRAADDAAGLAIAQKLRARVDGSAMASRNVHDAINLLGTAEGGLDGITGMLQRARELSVQAASTATMTAADREAAAAEVRQIVAEVDRIAGATSYNGMRLLDGSRTAGFSFQVGAAAGDALTVRIGDSDATALGLSGTAGVAGGTSTTTSTTSVTTYAAVSESFTSYNPQQRRKFDFTLNGAVVAQVSVNAGRYTPEELATILRAGLGSNPPVTINVLSGDTAGTSRLEVVATAAYGGSTTPVGVQVGGTNKIVFTTVATTEETTTSTETSVAAVPAAPSVAELVAAGSADAIDRIDAALAAVLSTRTDLGAVQNRLQHRLGVLAATEENLGAARSRIEDADMAVEYAALVRAQIVGQAATAMQAQQAAGGRRVLQLLTGL